LTPLIPAIFLIIHLSWGLGFWAQIFQTLFESVSGTKGSKR
jgi:hypothetical protein